MSAADIKIALIRAGKTQTDVARRAKVSPALVWRVIHRRDRSRRVEEALAIELNLSRDRVLALLRAA
jgi:DNA-binding LacI/PurR family transcriptional regulator